MLRINFRVFRSLMSRLMLVRSMLIVALIVVECFSLAHTIPSEKPLVETKYGKIIGKTQHFPHEDSDIKYVNTFLGVPYASPPIKNLRFQPTKPPTEWKPLTYNATTFKNVCVQKRHNYFAESIRRIWPGFTWEKDSSEDCLYLNIFAPRKNATNSSQLYPVLMFIHGGSYVFGTTARHTTPGEVLPRKGVVLVTIQYRLGAFGFITTGDDAARGNWGMLDQVQALKWTQENIQAFGGDPNRVTILGVSSGGASVGLHLLSPLSKGLFHQAIAESGVEFSPFAFSSVEKAVLKTKATAKKLGCDTKNHQEMIACLRTKDAVDIVDKYEWKSTAPVIDNHFMYDTPENLRRSGQFNPVPLIGGFNSDEGAHNTPPQCGNISIEISLAVFRDCIKTIVKKHMFHSNEKTARLMEEAIEFQYSPWNKLPDSPTLRQKVVDILSDYYVAAPTLEVLGIHSQKAPTYMYEFGHRSKLSMEEAWKGVLHGVNTPYDFGAPFLNKTFQKFNKEDQNVSSLIMFLYANFAKSGVPTPSPVHGVTWTEFNRTYKSYLLIQRNPEMQTNFGPYRMAFWNSYYPRLLNFSKNIAKSDISEPNRGNHNKGMGLVSNPGLLGIVLMFLLFAPVHLDYL